MNEKRLALGSKIKLSPVVIDWAESLKVHAGVYYTCYRQQRVYLIAAGEKPTGGFRIVANLSEGRGDTIHYHLEVPSPDDFVIQTITYPYEIIVVKDGKPLHLYTQVKGELKPVQPQETAPLTE